LSKLEEVVHVAFAQDADGQYLWAEQSDPTMPPDGPWHGPFRTEAEAEADMQKVLLDGAEVVVESDQTVDYEVSKRKYH
jgi:hypothetical protein